MKKKKILRIFGIALIFSLLAAVIPAAPALAYDYDISISPTSGMIGATITITGSDFSPSDDDTERYAVVYFSPTSVSVGTIIGSTSITTYEKVEELFIDEDGEFSGTFAIPTTLNDGTTTATVTPGTYYIYVCSRTAAADSTVTKSKATITVTQGATLDPISPVSGPAGTEVVISGFNFPASTALSFKLGTTLLNIKAGTDSITRASGAFLSTVTIPAGTAAGAHTLTVTAGVGTASATFTVTASPALSPISPTTGPAGTAITITGTAFPASTQLIFLFGATPVTPTTGSLMTDSAGNFMSIITAPSSVAAGINTITVTAGSTSLTAQFNLTGATTPPPTTPPATEPPTTEPPPSTGTTSIKIPSPPDYIGAQVTILAFDFAPGATVIFGFDGVQVATATADADGFATAAFNVPAGTHGEHTIAASDGVNSSSITFTVESTPPAIPQPNLPLMGAKIKSPFYFDWADVTDPSMPVTYNLQIATSKDFTTDSIVINKTGLTTSEYTLTEDEEKKVSDPDITYYWREKAVDAAMNESDWTGAAEFTAAQPFKFTGWPLYLTIGVGAVFFFLAGLWLGRRTAFYY